MNNLIKNALLNGRLVLLLGAGASANCKNFLQTEVPMGYQLAKILADEINESLDEEDLGDVYAAAKSILGSQVNGILEKYYKHCTPSIEYNELVKYPFSRIYTLNIDDAFEKAAINVLPSIGRKFNVRQRNDKIVETDQFFKTLDYIKLNGDINRVDKGFIFSPQEYGDGSATSPLWYEELSEDFHKYTFLFIGTKLREPLFYHQIAKFQHKTGESNLKSYILIPKLTSIQKQSLQSNNIEHIEGSLADFTTWLKNEFPSPPTSNDIISRVRPDLKLELNNRPEGISFFSKVTPVNRASLSLLDGFTSNSKIRNFYKGFKPTWFDIIDSVPVFLEKNIKFYNKFLSSDKAIPSNLFIIFGTAGSGKSTALKQIALRLSDESERNIYFADDGNINIVDLVQELDIRNEKPYYVFIDRSNEIAFDLAKIIESKRVEKAIFLTSENPKIWHSRVKEHLQDCVTGEFDISEIAESDVDQILDKLKAYGNWTRLEKLPPNKRRLELIKKSKKQLLIGLLEATSGEGYKKIIQKDYDSIKCKSEKSLLILAGLATTQGVLAHEVTLTRAMTNLGANPDIHHIASKMDGLVLYKNGNVNTRHRVYMENLFKLYVAKDDLAEAICAYIKAFSVYNFPIVKNISPSEFSIYKYLVNAKALRKLFNDNRDLIFSIYEKFEKDFENEGLFLMQYGLALRSFKENDQAYEKLKIAHQAFPESPHIEHALAMQRIILACDEKNEDTAMSLFSEAESVLNRLDSSRITHISGGTDKYPIITLSEGHVKVLDNLGLTKEARVIAKNYHERISKNSELKGDLRVKKTTTRLLKYALGEPWGYHNDDDF